MPREIDGRRVLVDRDFAVSLERNSDAEREALADVESEQ